MFAYRQLSAAKAVEVVEVKLLDHVLRRKRIQLKKFLAASVLERVQKSAKKQKERKKRNEEQRTSNI